MKYTELSDELEKMRVLKCIAKEMFKEVEIYKEENLEALERIRTYKEAFFKLYEDIFDSKPTVKSIPEIHYMKFFNRGNLNENKPSGHCVKSIV